jgi:hypothetical protein
MSGEKSLSAFEYIREINKLSSDILSPAKFKILVEIAIQAAENGNVLAKNKELSIKTGIKPNSIKVLMSQMKKNGFIRPEKIDGLRTINLLDHKTGKRLMVINQISEKVNGDLPFPAPPLLNKVVVVLLEKYGFDIGPVQIEKLNRFDVETQILAIEYTKQNATSNPVKYLDRILDNDCKGINPAVTKPVKTSYDIAREQDEKNRQRMGIPDDMPMSIDEMRKIKTINYAARA